MFFLRAKFDYIEDLIECENTLNMEQFVVSLTEFLTFRKYQLLLFVLL